MKTLKIVIEKFNDKDGIKTEVIRRFGRLAYIRLLNDSGELMSPRKYEYFKDADDDWECTKIWCRLYWCNTNLL